MYLVNLAHKCANFLIRSPEWKFLKFIFEIHFEIFESAKKNWRIEKYSDTCGRGAKACWQVELPK